jgi:hypothetical protein
MLRVVQLVLMALKGGIAKVQSAVLSGAEGHGEGVVVYIVVFRKNGREYCQCRFRRTMEFSTMKRRVNFGGSRI